MDDRQKSLHCCTSVPQSRFQADCRRSGFWVPITATAGTCHSSSACRPTVAPSVATTQSRCATRLWPAEASGPSRPSAASEGGTYATRERRLNMRAGRRFATSKTDRGMSLDGQPSIRAVAPMSRDRSAAPQVLFSRLTFTLPHLQRMLSGLLCSGVTNRNEWQVWHVNASTRTLKDFTTGSKSFRCRLAHSL